jgi:hypothetical protein
MIGGALAKMLCTPGQCCIQITRCPLFLLETNGTYTRLTTTDIAVHFGLSNKLNQYHPIPLQQQPNQNGTKARGRWFKQQCFCLPWRFLYNHRAGQLRSRRCFHRDLHRNPHCLFFNPQEKQRRREKDNWTAVHRSGVLFLPVSTSCPEINDMT